MIEGKEFAKLFSVSDNVALTGSEFAQKEFTSNRIAKKIISEAVKNEAKTGKNYMNVIKGRGGKMARAALKNSIPNDQVTDKMALSAARAITKAKGIKLDKAGLKEAANMIKEKTLK